MLRFILLLVACHYVVYEMYGSAITQQCISPEGAMKGIGIGIAMGLIVGVVATWPRQKSQQEKLDDIFKK